MAMAQAIQDVNHVIDEEMIDNRDEQKDDLRAELYMLLDELKRIGSSIVPDVEHFLAATIAQPALDQIPKLRGWIRRAEKFKTIACALQCPQSLQRAPQKTLPQPRKKGARGGLTYIVGYNGEAPKMQAIHCVFAKMAVEEMRKHCNVS
jgi:hypothetical protein